MYRLIEIPMLIRLFAPCLILVSTCLTCSGDEMVCLTTGFCLQASSHTAAAERLVFRIGSGSIEFQATEIASIEQVADSVPAKVKALLSAAQADDPQMLVTKAAKSQGIDPDFVRSVAKIESDFRQGSISKKGATGLMQIMPGTAKELGINPAEAQANVLGGSKYLRWLLVRYHFNSALTLAAYNAGPGAVEKFGGVPPFGETRAYIVKVTREYDRLRREAAASPEARITKASNKPTATN